MKMKGDEYVYDMVGAKDLSSTKSISKSNSTGSSSLSVVDMKSISSSSTDENKERGNWSGQLDFILSCIGYAVGLGNIWRFPYLCYRSGGGAFLIPYVLFLVVCGMPLILLEMSYGQFANLSPISAWRLSPLFKGIGWGMTIISGMVCIYYNIIITWTLYYLFMSFTDVLPWSTCGNAWNNELCAQRKGSNATNITMANLTGSTTDAVGYVAPTFASVIKQMNDSLNMVMGNETTKFETPSQQYWQRNVLEITEGIQNVGGVRWQLLLCLMLAWVMVFLCLIKGIKSSGKVVYVTAVFPYLVLIILCVRGVTLPGAMAGIKFYLIPDWSKLATFKVWGDAACQIFYSVGAAWGAMITLSSYNKFQHNVLRDAIVVPLINCATSIFAGLVIFSIVGFMAYETGVSVEEVVTQGPGLIFVVYPEALAKLPISPLWSVLFFMMVLTVGLDSQFGMFETLTSAFIDEYPRLLKNKKMLFTACLCLVEFLIGIPMITQGGIYVLQIMDWYSSVFSLMILSLLECLVISWIYGVDRFFEDINLMIGRKPFLFYKVCWRFITPGVIVFVLIFTFVTHTPVTYNKYTYPGWAIAIGWLLAVVSLAPIPGVALVQIYYAEGTLVQRIKELAKPDPRWGPAVPEFREMYLASLTPVERQRMVKNITTSSSLSTISDKEEQKSFCDTETVSTV